MKWSYIYKRLCLVLLLLMLLACGGGGGGGDSAPPPTPNIFLAQSSVDFAGTVLANTVDRTFVIKNTGTANLKIGQILQPTLPFIISSDTCSNATLTPSQTCSLGIRFSPTTQGAATTTLSIPSNDPDSGTVNVRLSGDGYGLNVWINKVNTASCPSISVDVTVTDPASGSLLGLTADKFKLYHNGQLQNISLIASQPSPISVVLTLDWSGSTINIIGQVEFAANSFINQLSNADWAAICKFSGDIGFDPPGPNPPLFRAGDAAGKSALTAYVNADFPSNNTVLYNAIFQSIDRAAQGPTDKRAVIVLSDGVDTHSAVTAPYKTLNQVIANATSKGIPIFTIYFVDPNTEAGDTQVMQRLASETGGQYYNSDTIDLNTIFQQISNVLSNKYTLNYSSSSTCAGTISVRADWNGLYGQYLISIP